MTIKEVIEIARQVTGAIDGVQYHGFIPANPNTILVQRVLVFIDPETDEPLYTSEPIFAEFFGLLKQLWDIPGLLPEGMLPGDVLWNTGLFSSEQNVAMMPRWNAQAHLIDVELDTGLNW